ncbi:hypothetical protein HanPI659440_Chr06g0231061 [Helianthus annuus]|nr:hypothetical protein HanPI659440_Chr06g0231061 [Helianthus annuus]
MCCLVRCFVNFCDLRLQKTRHKVTSIEDETEVMDSTGLDQLEVYYVPSHIVLQLFMLLVESDQNCHLTYISLSTSSTTRISEFMMYIQVKRHVMTLQGNHPATNTGDHRKCLL